MPEQRGVAGSKQWYGARAACSGQLHDRGITRSVMTTFDDHLSFWTAELRFATMIHGTEAVLVPRELQGGLICVTSHLGRDASPCACGQPDDEMRRINGCRFIDHRNVRELMLGIRACLHNQCSRLYLVYVDKNERHSVLAHLFDQGRGIVWQARAACHGVEVTNAAVQQRTRWR